MCSFVMLCSAATGLLDEEEDEEAFVSNYEKQHPLEVPRALTEVCVNK